MPVSHISDSERNVKLILFLHQLGVPLSDQEYDDLQYYLNVNIGSQLKRHYSVPILRGR